MRTSPIVLAAFFLATGCVDGAKQASRGTVVGAYLGLKETEDPLLRRLYAALDRDDLLRTSMADASAGFVNGVGRTWTDDRVAALAQKLTASVMEAALKESDQALAETFKERGPAIESFLRKALTNTIEDAAHQINESTKAELRQALATLSGAVIDGAGKSLDGEGGAAMERFLAGPLARGTGQVTQTIARDALIGAAEGAGKVDWSALEARVGSIAKTAGKNAVEGVKEANADLLQRSTNAASSIFIALTAVFGVLLTLAVMWLRKVSQQAALSERALMVIATKINESGDPELKRSIQESATKGRVQTWLDEFLKSRGL